MTATAEITTAGHGDVPLAEIALNAAIELERSEQGEFSTVWLEQLALALDETTRHDATLFPVYEHALALAGGAATDRSDLFSKLADFAEKLSSSKSFGAREAAILKDFCLALHDGLLNQCYERHHGTVLTARRAL